MSQREAIEEAWGLVRSGCYVHVFGPKEGGAVDVSNGERRCTAETPFVRQGGNPDGVIIFHETAVPVAPVSSDFICMVCGEHTSTGEG